MWRRRLPSAHGFGENDQKNIGFGGKRGSRVHYYLDEIDSWRSSAKSRLGLKWRSWNDSVGAALNFYKKESYG